tara:strand:+ start:388 stop:576 length:189 start_codon:yes stop_codon:yes gene_type:complete
MAGVARGAQQNLGIRMSGEDGRKFCARIKEEAYTELTELPRNERYAVLPLSHSSYHNSYLSA